MQYLAGAAYTCHRVPGNWSRCLHRPDARMVPTPAAPAMTKVLSLRRAEPVMGAQWTFAPWHEPGRMVGQIALCIISGHWPYSSCQNKWPGHALKDWQPRFLSCLQGRTCWRRSRLFNAVCVLCQEGKCKSGYACQGHAGQGHYGPWH